jgi:hypothetical protein
MQSLKRDQLRFPVGMSGSVVRGLRPGVRAHRDVDERADRGGGSVHAGCTAGRSRDA